MALTSTVALAEAATSTGFETHGIARILTDRLMDYAGLTEGTGQIDLATKREGASETAEPRVKAFGYETSVASENGLVGYDIGLNADLGWTYELPLYN